MKKSVFAVLFIITFSTCLFAYDGGHDTLLFDGTNSATFYNEPALDNCFIQVKAGRGLSRGTVMRGTKITGCDGKPVMIYTFEENQVLQIGDTLLEETEVEVDPGEGSWVGIGIYFTGDKNYGVPFPTQYMTVYALSKIKLPRIRDYCKELADKEKELAELKLLRGKLGYESKEGTSPKVKTKGKRSSAKHIKTKYTHEVRIVGADTVDIISVYEGSVEVTYVKTDASVDEDMSAKMQKLSQDMLEGKISAEEFQKQMAEFDAYGKNSMDLTKPVTVEEGSQCTVGRSTMKTEPIEPGDVRWWENN